jgi:hypothetical protein
MLLWRSLIRFLLALALVCAPVAANAAGLHELGLGTTTAASDACDHDGKATEIVGADAFSESASSNRDKSDSKGHCGACCLLAHGFAGLMPAPVSEPAPPFAVAAHLIAPDDWLAGRVLDPLNKPPRG